MVFIGPVNSPFLTSKHPNLVSPVIRPLFLFERDTNWVSGPFIPINKNVLFQKNIFEAVVSKYAKIDPKDGASCPHCECFSHLYLDQNLDTVRQESIRIKVNSSQLHQSTCPSGPESASIEILPFRPKLTYLVKVPLNVTL